MQNPYKNWTLVLIPVDYYNSPNTMQGQFTELSGWLYQHIDRDDWTFPIDQESGYWTFYLKNKDDAVQFKLTWGDYDTH